MRDQSYDDGSRPYRSRHSRIASSTRSRVQRRSIAPGMAGLAVRVRVALAVARLGVGAAAAAHADVARLDRPRLLPGRVVEVRLDRRRRAAEPLGDLRDREALDLAVVARQRDRAAALNHPVMSRRIDIGSHPFQVLLGSVLAPDLPLASRLGGSAGFSALIVLGEAEPGERQELADAMARPYQLLVSDHPREVRTLPKRAHDPLALARHQDRRTRYARMDPASAGGRLARWYGRTPHRE